MVSDGPAAVLVFDLDGTLYRSEAALLRYAREVAHRLPADAGAGFEARITAHLGRGPSLPGEDDWQALAAHARAVGIEPVRLREAFDATRRWMVEGDCPLERPAGLPAFLARVRRTAFVIVASNSPPSSVGPLLARLGLLALVDEVAAAVGKPAGLVPVVRRLVAAHGLEGLPVMSIGDNHANDILPPQGEGWATAYVRAGRPARPATTCSADSLEELLPCVLAWLDAVAARRERQAVDGMG